MVAEVIIISNVKGLNKIFDYEIPTELVGIVRVGSKVLVPFGRYKGLTDAYVISLKEKSNYKLKQLAKLDEQFSISENNINLAKIMSKRYFCNIADAIKLMLPPGTLTKDVSNRVKEKSRDFVFLNKEVEEIQQDIMEKKVKSEKQINTLEFLIENDGILASDLEVFAETSRTVINTLKKNGYIEIEERQVVRNPFKHKNVKSDSKLILNEEQKIAYDKINNCIELNKHKTFLIHGVTGSGKTEIYMQLIEKVLSKNKNAILLVPEISLTPQMVDRFIARFGQEKIAVLHSKLSLGERFDEWNRIRRKEANIVIGARSAVFAPIDNLGIIIIDEEHDPSYKADITPRYNAKDIAGYLAKENKIPFVLGSATPDITTFYKANNEEIELLSLKKRANKSDLPNIQIVDLREELINGNKSMISKDLYNAIERNLKNKNQTILFLNRRGFSTFVMCRDCGYTVKCKNCNITLTYHLDDKKLKCHYCGYEQENVKTCPECNSKKIKYFGAGTQKLEEEINKLFPNASTIRMDIDTVKKKNSHEEILNKFKDENIDILIGTQMVVKGHHFPNVTLVGVIAADSSLNIEDYRADERTFNILTQVAGRAGREKNKGNVIIQTYNPDNFCIECVKEQDYFKLYNTEINVRKQLKFPPFCDIIVIGFTGNDLQEIKVVSEKIYNILNTKQDEIAIYKPFPSPIDKIKGKYRWRIIIKCKLTSKIIDNINYAINKIGNTSVRIGVDVNPNNMA